MVLDEQQFLRRKGPEAQITKEKQMDLTLSKSKAFVPSRK